MSEDSTRPEKQTILHIGEEVRRRREAKGWSQAKLAGAAGMGVSGVSQIETGARNPSAITLGKIAEALGVKVGDLFPKHQTILHIGEPYPEELDPELHRANEAAHRVAREVSVFARWEPATMELFPELRRALDEYEQLVSTEEEEG